MAAWTQEELDLIRRGVSEGKNPNQIQETLLPHRSYGSVSGKMAHLGYKQHHYTKGEVPQEPLATEEIHAPRIPYGASSRDRIWDPVAYEQETRQIIAGLSKQSGAKDSHTG